MIKSLLPNALKAKITVYALMLLPVVIVTLSFVSSIDVNAEAYYYNKNGELQKLQTMRRASVTSASVSRFVRSCTADMFNNEFLEGKNAVYRKFEACLSTGAARQLWFSLEDIGYVDTLINGQSFSAFSTINPPRIIGSKGTLKLVQTSGVLTLRNIRDVVSYNLVLEYYVELNKEDVKMLGDDSTDGNMKAYIITRAKAKLERI